MKPIPESTQTIILRVEYCGDEECNCCAASVYAYIPCDGINIFPWLDGETFRGEKLWETSRTQEIWYLEKQIMEAIKFYNLLVPDKEEFFGVSDLSQEKNLITGETKWL